MKMTCRGGRSRAARDSGPGCFHRIEEWIKRLPKLSWIVRRGNPEKDRLRSQDGRPQTAANTGPIDPLSVTSCTSIKGTLLRQYRLFTLHSSPHTGYIVTLRSMPSPRLSVLTVSSLTSVK